MKSYANLTICSLCATTLLAVSGCSEAPRQKAELTTLTSTSDASENTPYLSSVVFAMNIGGEEYIGKEGIIYKADSLLSDYRSGHTPKILGSQDPTLFQDYRISDDGSLSLSIPLETGIYSATFKFAEPNDIQPGDRVFNIEAEGKIVIEELDVRVARDNKINSELTRTATDIEVTDGSLDISLDSITGQPLLHAIVVRKKVADERNWQLVWSDEFSTDGTPDSDKWSFDEWPARKVNDEDQAYTSRAKNVRVNDGKLIIEAHKEQYKNAEYTSARLHNKGTGDFLYGKVEVLARIPKGQGTWSAIWMLPSDPFKYASTCQTGDEWQGSAKCDAWPNSGEIDILEHVGYDMQTVHGTVHNRAYYWMNWEQRKASVEGKTVDTEFHLYSLEWTPDDITIYFDNYPYFYYKNEGDGWQSWPFDHPFHLILNLAIGGEWGRSGGPIDDSIFPVKMEVDYVRIYQLAK